MSVTVIRNADGSFLVKSETNSYVVRILNDQAHWGAWFDGDEGSDEKTLAEAPTALEMIGWLVLDLTQ